MQHRYVGDIGDFVKFALLRALAPGRKLGVAWWLFPDESHNADGRHITYIQAPERWRHRDPALFDAMRSVIAQGRRNVDALEAAALLEGAIYHAHAVPVEFPSRERPERRRQWFAETCVRLRGCDLVFVDPDNGLAPTGYRPGARKSGKSVTLAELAALAAGGRPLLVYHHHTRYKGGHQAEIESLALQFANTGFRRVLALRAKPYAPRVFFLLDGDDELSVRARRFAQAWEGDVSCWESP